MLLKVWKKPENYCTGSIGAFVYEPRPRRRITGNAGALVLLFMSRGPV